MRAARTAAVLLVLLVAPALAAPEASGGLAWKPVRLSPKERLALPRLRVPVGPEDSLFIAGRARPVGFGTREGGEELLADLDGEPGAEIAVRSGGTFLVPLDGGGDRAFVLVGGDPDRGEPLFSAVALDGLAGRIGRENVTFLDHDADGRCLTAWRDFLATRRGDEVHPVAPAVVLGRAAWRLAIDGEAGTVAAEPAPEFADREVFPRWADVADGLRRLNEVRAGMNLPPVALDREASRAALLHLRYCEQNGGNVHVERPDFPGYTKEGALAGLSAIGWHGGGSGAAAVDGHLGSLLHRMELIDPTIARVGIAAAGDRIWIHTECGDRRPWNGQGPVIFPGPDGAWPSGHYTGDNPDPRPEPKGAGLPLTVAWYGDERIREVRAELRTSRGKVPVWKNDADGRELSTNCAKVRAVILPQDTLTSGVLTVTWLEDDRPCRLEHTFRIGR